MRELFTPASYLDDQPMTPEQLAEAMRIADVLVPTVTDTIDEAMLAQPDVKVKLIAHFGNGVDNIDVKAAHRRGISPSPAPKVFTPRTATTMALTSAVPRG